jgi:hypothetical protein
MAMLGGSYGMLHFCALTKENVKMNFLQDIFSSMYI